MKKKHVKIGLGVATGLLLTAIFGSVGMDMYTLHDLQGEDRPERPMTTGEIAMAQRIYGNDIDYSPVRFHYSTPHGDDARAHGNNIYLETDALHVADFSDPAVSKDERKILIHELYHVLRSQQGGTSFWESLRQQPAHIINNLFGTRLGYDFDINSKKTFAEYNEEQQASMIEEYFRATQVFDRIVCEPDQSADARLCADVHADVAKYEQKLKPALPLPGARTLTLNPR